MQQKSPEHDFAKSVATIEALMYEAVNALCQGSVTDGRKHISSAVESIKHLNAAPDTLSEDDQTTLQEVSGRVFLVQNDIDDMSEG